MGRDGKVDTGIDLVTKDRYGDGSCAIQCKFYASTYNLQKGDIDSFFTASAKYPFTSRTVVSTPNDWSQYSLTKPDGLPRVNPKALREHQLEAVAKVEQGFKGRIIGALRVN